MTSEGYGTIAGVPTSFRWLGTASSYEIAADSLSIAAGPGTDWFVDPGSGAMAANAPALIGALEGEFGLAARTEVSFASTFDAGALVLWRNERTWAKLALELSPQGEAVVVSVVTRGESDDCNSMVVDSGVAWLRVSCLGGAHAFHASLDGRRWQFVRHFRLGGGGPPEVGFEAQSPLGEGCAARFSGISYTPGLLADLRNGE